MESGVFVGDSGRQAPRASGSSRVPCRNFARGTCRWGQNCRFSHDRKMTQICRYFQNGFCGYGDRCSYQHISEASALSRCGSEPAFHGLQGGMISLNRRGSEPAILPETSLSSCGGARRGSEPTFLSAAQQQRNFGSVSVSLDEEDEDKEKGITACQPPNWALSKEFVPRQPPSGSWPHEQKEDTSSLEAEDSSSEEPLPASVIIPKSKAAGGFGAAAAAAAKEKSEDVVCGICMDRIYEKSIPEERLFGILPNCSHAYCVGCIRKWRKSRDFQNAVIKGCPECRVTSSYFIPNKYWVSDTDEKEKLIETFKARTGKIRCKFFVRSNGHCPFKSECIYLHELPGGHVPVPRPRRRPDRRRQQPIVYNLSPSESSDEDDEDLCLIPWALTIALLEQWDSEYFDMFWDASDSD